MRIVKGIYAEAKICTDDVEGYAEAQVKMICDSEAAEGVRRHFKWSGDCAAAAN